MGGMDLDLPPAFRVDPTAENATAGKHQLVLAVPIDDGEFEIAVERSGRSWLPHKRNYFTLDEKRIDLNHIVAGGRSRHAGD